MIPYRDTSGRGMYGGQTGRGTGTQAGQTGQRRNYRSFRSVRLKPRITTPTEQHTVGANIKKCETLGLHFTFDYFTSSIIFIIHMDTISMPKRTCVTEVQ